MGVGGRAVRPRRRPVRTGAGADADDSHLRDVHRPVVLRPDLVAPADLSLSGRSGDRRRMGGGGGPAVGNLAAPLGALDRGRPPIRGQLRGAAGDGRGVPPLDRPLPQPVLPVPLRIPRGRVAGVAGAVDSPQCARTRRVAHGQDPRRTRRAADSRPVSRQDSVAPRC